MPLLLAQSSPLAPPAGSPAVVTALFYLFALMAAGSAITVVVSRNIVRNAVALLFTLLGVAGLYFLLDAEFLAAVQLVVYAGGTLILIVFGVMLTSKSPFARFEPKLGEIVVASTVGAVLLVALSIAISRFAHTPAIEQASADAKLGASSPYPVRELGAALLGDYLVPFELVSVLLLVVMIGAAYLAKGRRPPLETPEQQSGVTEGGVQRPSTGLAHQARQWS